MAIMEVRTVTDVRENFSQFLDDVTRKSPQAIKRHRDSFITMSPVQLDAMLVQVSFTLEYSVETDGSYSGALLEVGIVANAPSLDALRKTLAEYLLDYAKDYLVEFNRYFAAPNRRAHFPFIMKAIAQPDLDSLAALFSSHA